ncbi:MAG TPA: PPOX class F420-dependent oxidoreductase [Trebonia sp.]|jgi:pyridoxamine 5'-phosphate oxidase family protein|nr:PPOX class F420-dependent oxidoreductase [Trebonia sp.]
MTLTEAEQRYLSTQTHARLATVGPDGTPQVKPVGFKYNPELGTIDIYGFDMARSAKYRNVQQNPKVALVADDAPGAGPAGVRFLEIRGIAETASGADPFTEQQSPEIIRIHPRRVLSFNVDPAHPGLQTRDITSGEPVR